MIKYSFDNTQSFFFNILRKKVNHYFNEEELHMAGNMRLYWKCILQVLFAAGLYVILVFFTPAIWISIVLCVVLGLNLSIIGFNVMHEGGHQSFSKHPWINTISAHFLNVLGGNAYFWKVKHNVNHHTYTNIEGMDSDIDVKPFMRLHHGQPLRSYHRFQHIYWIVLYGISYLAWVFYEDFQKYFTGRISPNSPKKSIPNEQHFVFWISKALYIFIYMVLPVIIVGWLPWLVGFLIITVFCGISTSVVFQLAHIVEGTQFVQPLNDDQKKDWAVHQVITTANFGTSSRTLHWLLGGLNFQIEHHLFPRVSHVHYPAIRKFVKETCDEYGIVYNEYRSMFVAFVSHLVHLHRLGRA